jgi:hypothetical protein
MIQINNLKTVVGNAVDAVISKGAKRAVKYLTPDCIVRATFIGKRRDAYSSNDIRLSIGKPNYLERRFIRLAIAAGQKFPIKKIQLKFSKE